MRSVYLAGALRTPIGRFSGSLASWTAADLGTAVAKESFGCTGVRITTTLLHEMKRRKASGVSRRFALVVAWASRCWLRVFSFWSAPAERSGDGALDLVAQHHAGTKSNEMKAPSPLRSAGALQNAANQAALERHRRIALPI
jgi:hypothetical protein